MDFEKIKGLAGQFFAYLTGTIAAIEGKEVIAAIPIFAGAYLTIQMANKARAEARRLNAESAKLEQETNNGNGRGDTLA